MSKEPIIIEIAKAMCADDGAKWDAADFGETANGESPDEQREYWIAKAEIAVRLYRDALGREEAILPMPTKPKKESPSGQ